MLLPSSLPTPDHSTGLILILRISALIVFLPVFLRDYNVYTRVRLLRDPAWITITSFDVYFPLTLRQGSHLFIHFILGA